MKPTDRKRFIEIVVGFAELKGKQLSPPALEIYWRSMRDWDFESFAQAAEQLLRTCEFMPTPKNFEDLKRAARPTSGEAWAKVLAHVRGGWCRWEGGGVSASLDPRIPAPPDALTAKAVEVLGGYKAIAMTNESELHWLEKRFCEHYESIRDAQEIRQALPELTHSAMQALPKRDVKGLLEKLQ